MSAAARGERSRRSNLQLSVATARAAFLFRQFLCGMQLHKDGEDIRAEKRSGRPEMKNTNRERRALPQRTSYEYEQQGETGTKPGSTRDYEQLPRGENCC